MMPDDKTLGTMENTVYRAIIDACSTQMISSEHTEPTVLYQDQDYNII